MQIQILGSGCPTCKQLFETTKKIANELNIDTEVEYINDVSKMIEMGVMQSPVLAIDGRIIFTGGGKSEEDIKKILQENIKNTEDSENGCSCCHGCC